jgi:NAD dependent epimerase/dehydratase family enzyme
MNFLTQIFRNWKTTAAGIALLAITVMYLRSAVTLQDYLGAFAMLAAGGGFIVSQDGQK